MDDTFSSEIATAIAAARALGDETRAKFKRRLNQDTARWTLEPADIDFLARITHRRISGRALLSNEHVHRVAQNALIGAMAEAYEEHDNRQWLWITLAWDAGVTLERAPDIDFVSLRGIAYQHLRRSGLHGFGIVEVDTWKNFTGEQGRRIVAHVHFIGHSADGSILDPKGIEADLRKRPALLNSLGARSADVQEVTMTPADFARIGQYMLKRPAYAKDPLPRILGGGWKLKGVEHAAGSVARLTETFSQCEVGDVMFSIGDGQEIANKVRQAVREEIRERPGATPAPSREEVAFHWKRIRVTNGSKNFLPCRIIARAEQRGEPSEQPKR